MVKEKWIDLNVFCVMSNHTIDLANSGGYERDAVQINFLKFISQTIQRDLKKHHPKVLEKSYVGSKDRDYLRIAIGTMRDASFLFASVTIIETSQPLTMRSALTDTPATSFTTLLLRATQHATGLMVKVAPLLPPRDLLSSQRSFAGHTKVFAKAGLDNVTSAMCKHQQRFGLDVEFSALVHNFSNIFSIGHFYQAGRSMNSLSSQILKRYRSWGAFRILFYGLCESFLNSYR
ncbi:hypothetical protein BH20BAC1_BH20BAC1_09080 [soil metagenome]